MKIITPCLLAGGSGTRLWPLSRKSYPKQFTNLVGEKSLFQQAVERSTTSENVQFGKYLTLTNSEFRFIVNQQIRSIGYEPGTILIEPEGKNTGPAILAASLYELEKNSEAILLVTPTDQIISSKEKFHEAICKGMSEIQKGQIITFGIKPTFPETGYGYLELMNYSTDQATILKSYIEKPNFSDAERMISSGKYLWNTGIFLFFAKDMVAAFEKYFSRDIESIKDALKKGTKDLNFFRLKPEHWSNCTSISIDYAVMESAKNLSAVRLESKWSDLGDWKAVGKEMKSSQTDVFLSKNAHASDCSNTILRSENPKQEIVGLGLKNIIAVAMPDAVLVADREHSQNVGKIVRMLTEKEISQAEILPKDYRPWGWFEVILSTDQFQVKQITVNPNSALSLQSHSYRSEHWVVVHGTAKVTVNDLTTVLSKGESVYIPLNAIHRLENTTSFPTTIIEVQTGTYLGEDDIVRYEDLYSRDKK